MKTSTILVVAGLAVGGYFVVRRFSARVPASNPTAPPPQSPTAGSTPLDTLRGFATAGRDIVDAGRAIYDDLFGAKR